MAWPRPRRGQPRTVAAAHRALRLRGRLVSGLRRRAIAGWRRIRLDVDGPGAPEALPMDAGFVRRPAALRLGAAAPPRPGASRGQSRSRCDLADGKRGGG